mgnify:CR=1 FL=1
MSYRPSEGDRSTPVVTYGYHRPVECEFLRQAAEVLDPVGQAAPDEPLAALDKKLQPVLHRLHQMDEGPRLADIIGGIGYGFENGAAVVAEVD